MACPRCGGRLERYELSDRVEAACVDCGYVGVPVDHGSERARQESWAAAMERVESQVDASVSPPPRDPPTGARRLLTARQRSTKAGTRTERRTTPRTRRRSTEARTGTEQLTAPRA
ncbi:hypothetical protein BRD18_01275 [Halobacteriales archaeon SW_7_71_33]|nr:MAG: hypothetical protein BRD18_01275 [Halobacteriales archaeon SW_7_71_33]